MSDSRQLLAEVQEKVFLYLKLQRYSAVEDLLAAAIAEHGPLANLLNWQGLTAHHQSKFQESIQYFEKALASNPRFTEAALNLAVTLSDLGFYEASSKVYQELRIAIDPQRSLPTLTLGRLANLHAATARYYEEAGLTEQALSEYVRALEVYPKMPDIRIRLAKLYLRIRSYHLAREQLQIVLAEHPQHAESLNLMGAIAYRLEDFEQAELYWQKSQNHLPGDKRSRSYLKASQSFRQSELP